MKLLFTVHRFYPDVGGSEEAVKQLALGMAKRGHEVHVVTSTPVTQGNTNFHQKLNIHRFNVHNGMVEYAKAMLYIGDVKNYIKCVENIKPDVTIVFGQRIWSSDCLYRILDKLHPSIFIPSGVYCYSLFDRVHIRLWLSWFLKQFDSVLALTSKEEKQIKKLSGVEAKRISWGIELPKEGGFLNFKEKYGVDKKMLFYVGGYYDNKRVHKLVEMMRYVDGAKLVCVGNNTKEKYNKGYCEKLAKNLGVTNKIIFLERIPQSDVLSGYRSSDLFLLASDFEGFGIVFLESISFNKPFVSTDCGIANDLGGLVKFNEGDVYIDDNKPGAVIPTVENEVEIMGAVVSTLLNRPDMVTNMKKACMKIVSEYTWDKSVDTLEETCKELK